MSVNKQRTLIFKILVAIGVAAFLVLADPRPLYFSVGVCVTAFGVVIRFWTYGYLQKNRVLVMTGPYAHTRNPAYFGSFVAMIGLFISAGNPASPRGIASWLIGIIGVVVFLGWYLPAKYAREYPRLRAAFPEQFTEHAATTPDFFPRLAPARRDQEQQFSWRMLVDSRELKRPIIVAVALALMWLV